MEICLWPRGDYILEHLLPNCSSLPDLDVILQLIQELAPLRPSEVIESDTWYSSCRYLDIPWDTASRVYKNCTSASCHPRAVELCLDLVLLSLKPKEDDHQHSRDDQIAEFFHNNMTLILKILLLDPASEVRDEFLSALDSVFEGMIDGRPETASRIVRIVWNTVLGVGVKALAKRFSTCLIPDPFRLCHLVEGEKRPHGLRKKTSLAPIGRRMVTVSGWRRLQLLTKSIYRGAHFRLNNSLPKPSSIFALSHSLSIILENIADCPCLLLGPCSGTVELRNMKNCSITVACRRLIMENLEDCSIFLTTQIPPIMRNCERSLFAPFNAAYSGLSEELHATKIRIPGCFHPEERDPSWSYLPESLFYIQPVPTVCLNEDKLLDVLPEKYLQAARISLRSPPGKDVEEIGLRTSDIYYLKTKVEEV